MLKSYKEKEEKENKGWTPNPNTLLESWALEKLPGRKLRIKIFVYRKTIGFGKAEDTIPFSQYKAGCGIGKRHAYQLVQEMIEEKHLIIENGKTRLVLTSEQWNIVTEYGNVTPLPFMGKSVTVPGGKNVTVPGDLIIKTKQTNQNKENFYKKLSGKEIEKLELDQWYRAIMYNVGEFSIFYIEGTIDDYPYNARMSCWYEYEGAVNVRNKEAFFSNILRNYREDLK